MPYIDKNFIDDLQNSADIIEVVNRRVSLKKAGANYQACCPFHNEKTPSFSVSPSKQLFKCFGCGEAGGVLQFIQKYDHIDFPESVEVLAGELSMPVVYEQNNYSPQENIRLKEELSKKQKLTQLITQVSAYYELQLLQHPLRQKVVTYVKARQLTGKIAKRFALGFAPPNAKDILSNFPLEQHEDLVVLGVLGRDRNDAKKYYARFRDRLVFPIQNNKGEVIGFGARALSAEAKPKYLNSPETPLFSKSHELYGLHHCRKYSKDLSHILIVEGYMDVISLHQHGVTNAVAALGTATSESHLSLLSRSTKTIVFCFDGDNAGKKAAWRALEIALPWLKKGIHLKFLFLPDGEDPDTLVQKEGKNKFLARIDKALSLSTYLFEHLKSLVDFASGEGKTDFIEQAIEQIAKVNYDIYQEQLITRLSELSQYPSDKIQAKLEQIKLKNTQREAQRQIHQQNQETPAHSMMPADYDQYDESQFDIGQDFNSEQLVSKETTPQLNPTLKNAIHLLLHYPNIANGVEQSVLSKIKLFDNGDILYELLTAIEYDNNHKVSNIEELIKPLSKHQFFQTLQDCANTQPIINNESGAKIGWNENISLLEKQYLQSQVKQLMSKQDLSHDEKLQVLELLTQVRKLS